MPRNKLGKRVSDSNDGFLEVTISHSSRAPQRECARHIATGGLYFRTVFGHFDTSAHQHISTSAPQHLSTSAIKPIRVSQSEFAEGNLLRLGLICRRHSAGSTLTKLDRIRKFLQLETAGLKLGKYFVQKSSPQIARINSFSVFEKQISLFKVGNC
jgi:hypothetical protein